MPQRRTSHSSSYNDACPGRSTDKGATNNRPGILYEEKDAQTDESSTSVFRTRARNVTHRVASTPQEIMALRETTMCEPLSASSFLSGTADTFSNGQELHTFHHFAQPLHEGHAVSLPPGRYRIPGPGALFHFSPLLFVLSTSLFFFICLP